jgi:pterin-4a-carbinolamine dehydratase
MAFLDWTELNNKLEKTFKFNNYNEVVQFTNQVMQIAIEQDHHP